MIKENAMSHPTAHNHDLENHIEDLRKLDEARKKSAELRDEGIDVLMECLHQVEEKEEQPAFGDWRGERSLIVRALRTLQDQPFSDEKKEAKRQKLIKRLIRQLQENFTLNELAERELSVLMAASVLQALTAQPGGAFSKTAMLCYYWIIRELYSANWSDWNIGGARAAPGGLVTAFTTGECVRALRSFAEAQRKTGEFIEKVGEYLARIEELEHLKSKSKCWAGKSDPKPFGKWVEAEESRLMISCSLDLESLSNYLVLQLIPSDAGGSIEKYLNDIDTSKFYETLEGEIRKVKDEFSSTLEELLKYRGEHNGSDESIGKGERAASIREALAKYLRRDSFAPSALKKNQFRDIARSESAHLIAAMSLKDASHRVQQALDFFDKDDKKLYEKIKRGFDEAADKVQNLMYPVNNYLSSVLDRELALASLGESWDCQPCELASAAASYGRLTNDWKKDVRFSRAVGDLSKMISSCGRFSNPRHFHERPDGGRHMLGNAVILHAMAELLHYTRDNEIEPDLADKMLRFFEDTRADQLYEEVWRFSALDITPGMVEKLATKDDRFSRYIREKLAPPMSQLLKSSVNLKDLPKPFYEAIVEQLVTSLNELLRDDPIDDADGSPFVDTGQEIREMLADKKLYKGEQYFCRLLNRLCLQKQFLNGNPKTYLEQAVKLVKSDKKGWAWEFSQPPLKTGLTATADAVLALAEINEMLDARINHMILEHFSVKEKNKGLKADLTLDTVFYPDYGLSSIPDSVSEECPNERLKQQWPEEPIKRESAAIYLQRMRAHLSRAILPKSYEPLCSFVLHGPAGTGKTTLVEALAVTCDVPLVEVTPSDLVKRGGENIEERARAVFEALSLLTRAVILFDEFDPVLKRRDVATNNPLSVFSFLTPGMLPKLKELHERADKRSVAYVLVTNLIGELDEAAVRQGRFDERLGIYPPDLLSRVGRFLDQCYRYREENDGKEKLKDEDWKRICEVIEQSGGKGMTALGKPGWFTRPKKGEEPEANTPFAYVLKNEGAVKWPEPDDVLKGILGEGRTAVTECLQWMWITKWDKKLKNAKTGEALIKALNESASLTEPLQPEFAQSSGENNGDCIFRRR